MRSLIGLLLGALVAAAAPVPAGAWTRPAHMVTAAIAYDEIERTRPALLEALGGLLEAHPDRGPFQVAIDRSTGAERRRRMFLECARWPDDARLTAYDHPSWHSALSPVVAADADAATRTRATRHGGPSGEALEAFALNYRVLSDSRAPAAERAVALCWVLHLVGDIHQPLHTAELFSSAYPDGDGGGARQYVKDPVTGEPIALHWLWDDSIHRSGLAAEADARGREIAARLPRASLRELGAPPGPQQFAAWAREESYPLAVAAAFGAGAPTSPSPQAAPPVPGPYWDEVRRISERRVALAGYRMAELVILAMDGSR